MSSSIALAKCWSIMIFGIPWRETKFEQAADFGGALKGLFLHIEMIQPRRAAGHGGRNDARSPDPAFTPAQYDRLALLYTIASVRAERWLIPAFHAALDSEIRNGHDDPLNFDIDSFAASLDRLTDKLQHTVEVQASLGAITPDAPSGDKSIPYAVTAIDDPPPPAETTPPASGSDPQVRRWRHQAKRQSPHLPMLWWRRRKASRRLSRKSPVPNIARRTSLKAIAGAFASLIVPKVASAEAAFDQWIDDVSHEGHRARHHGGNVHARHARGSSRHDRARGDP